MRRPQAFTRHGHYYVRYEDGVESMFMPKDVAEDYAKMFGGVVIHDTCDEEVCPLQASFKGPRALALLLAILLFFVGFQLVEIWNAAS